MERQFELKTLGGLRVRGKLNNTKAGERFWNMLPHVGWINRWGGELSLDLEMYAESDETCRSRMQLGEMAYWSAGSKLCIFTGPTPISDKGEIRAIGDLSVLGMIIDDPAQLKHLGYGEMVLLDKVVE
ncbi:hypothetical protein JW905_06305 [bacterium]|nr:hypothetical protein [candidate division CSSED10-310 bacterium]